MDNTSLGITVQKDGTSSFPILRDLYQFFSPRSKSITVLSYGLGELGVETYLMSSTGCKITVHDARPNTKEKFDKYFSILKNHAADTTANEWEKELSQRWILSKNLSFSQEIPFTFSGSIDLSGNPTQLQVFSYEHVDFCKIDYDTFNTSILYSILNAGYRPGLLLINWSKHPDQYNDSMLCAGHLQNTGYTLVSSEENWFLYMFNDQNLYETCSWARSDVANPLIEEIKSVTLTNLLNSTSNKIESNNTNNTKVE